MVEFPSPSEQPDPVGPDVSPAPEQTPYPEISPDTTPLEAPDAPNAPDYGEPSD